MNNKQRLQEHNGISILKTLTYYIIAILNDNMVTLVTITQLIPVLANNINYYKRGNGDDVSIPVLVPTATQIMLILYLLLQVASEPLCPGLVCAQAYVPDDTAHSIAWLRTRVAIVRHCLPQWKDSVRQCIVSSSLRIWKKCQCSRQVLPSRVLQQTTADTCHVSQAKTKAVENWQPPCEDGGYAGTTTRELARGPLHNEMGVDRAEHLCTCATQHASVLHGLCGRHFEQRLRTETSKIHSVPIPSPRIFIGERSSHCANCHPVRSEYFEERGKQALDRTDNERAKGRSRVTIRAEEARTTDVIDAITGKNDAGAVKTQATEINDGNSGSLLKFRVQAGDSVMEKHIEIFVDETTDIRFVEQPSLCVRWLDVDKNKIHEDFLSFTPVKDLTGQGIAETIIAALKHHGIHDEFLIGQGYYCASSMSGYLHGAQAYTQLKERFQMHKPLITAIQKIIPTHSNDATNEELRTCAEFYKTILPKHSTFDAEFSIWKNKWLKEDTKSRPANASDAFAICDKNFFPNMKKLLQVIATLPVSTATPE
ncbi:hypothetical protein PR048_023278 [Dryococelus australis]|uniref:Uncharacterized protein n=1 Tax=Dryococelus australis TaxID=614101 RepID=A0ABQ9GTM8_9NEOP|nr:hypothetical protein PR048_023278 [Dryococelus australis]